MESDLVKEAKRLRSRAKWYRMFARLGDPTKRPDREALATRFEHMAEQAEKRTGNE